MGTWATPMPTEVVTHLEFVLLQRPWWTFTNSHRSTFPQVCHRCWLEALLTVGMSYSELVTWAHSSSVVSSKG